jgi:hypothetical protein
MPLEQAKESEMIIELGSRKIERLRFIARQGKVMTKKGRISKSDPDGVMKFCERMGYVLVNAQPVHKILLEHARSGKIGKKDFPLNDPLGIVKGLALFTAERPLK